MADEACAAVLGTIACCWPFLAERHCAAVDCGCALPHHAPQHVVLLCAHDEAEHWLVEEDGLPTGMRFCAACERLEAAS